MAALRAEVESLSSKLTSILQQVEVSSKTHCCIVDLLSALEHDFDLKRRKQGSSGEGPLPEQARQIRSLKKQVATAQQQAQAHLGEKDAGRIQNIEMKLYKEHLKSLLTQWPPIEVYWTSTATGSSTSISYYYNYYYH